MQRFKTQKEAFDNCLDTQITFAVNYENSKSCFFVNATEKEFWDNYMVSGPRNNYEKIKLGKECHLFLDIDKYETQYPGVDIEEIWKDVKDKIECVFINILNIERHRLHFIKLESHSKKKKSLHVIVKVDGTIFKNLIHCGIFVHNLKGEVMYPDVIDTSIYTKNRNFRMLGCSKAGQNRQLVGDKPFSYEYWLETLIQPLKWEGSSIEMCDEEVEESTICRDIPELVHNIFVNVISKDKKLHKMTGELNLDRIVSFPDSLTYVCNTKARKCPFVNRYHNKNVQFVVLNLLKNRYTLRCHSAKCKENKDNQIHFKLKDYLSEKICI